MSKLTKTEKYLMAGAVVLVITAAIIGFAFGRGGVFGPGSRGRPFGSGEVGSWQGQMNGDKKSSSFRGNGVLGGEIISREASSLQLQLNDGGSRLVRFSSTTQVQKMTEGSLDDLAVGSSVNISGQTNADGSLSAKSIQIRPETPLGGGAGR